jgi:tRNA threonylcarbamoyladenosine biosynthesis protein TsaB
MIMELLERCEAGPSDLGLVGLTSGPGAFTGLRLGLVTAKTIAQVLRIPIIGVNTLDVVAARCSVWDGCLVVAADARRKEVFSIIYRLSVGARTVARPLKATSAEDLAREIEVSCVSPVFIAGNALERYGAVLTRSKKVLVLDRDLWYPRASRAALLALERYEAGESGTFLTAGAFYFRPPDIQVDSGTEATRNSAT